MKTSNQLRPVRAAVCLALVTAALAGCGGTDGGKKQSTDLPHGSEPVHLDPADFTTRIDNPYRPMSPGSRTVYRSTDSEGTVQRDELTVTNKTKRMADGIEARVVRDTTTENGEVVEDGYDWYAQDSRGNVWYLGELAREYEDGKLAKTSKWEAGVDGAQPGVVMAADPRPGISYRQTHYAGEEEGDDRAKVLAVRQLVQSPAGHFKDAVLIVDSSPLEPGSLEYKLFARGVGLVRSLVVSGGSDHEELLSYSKGK
jgi:hypothetical protein